MSKYLLVLFVILLSHASVQAKFDSSFIKDSKLALYFDCNKPFLISDFQKVNFNFESQDISQEVYDQFISKQQLIIFSVSGNKIMLEFANVKTDSIAVTELYDTVSQKIKFFKIVFNKSFCEKLTKMTEQANAPGLSTLSLVVKKEDFNNYFSKFYENGALLIKDKVGHTLVAYRSTLYLKNPKKKQVLALILKLKHE